MPTLVLISVVLWGGIFCNADHLAHHIILKEDSYELFYDYNEENVTFEIHVETKGYIGFGLSPNGGMAGADIVIGWVKDGEVFFHDRHATRNEMPIIDESQDWILDSGSENDTHTVMRFHRPIKNCDPDDIDITETTTRLIWAYAKEDPTGEDSVFYHGADKRGTKSVQLLNAMRTPPPIPDDAINVDITLPNVTIPAQSTIYWCEYLELQQFDKDHHMIMYEPVVSQGNEAFVHHILAYACAGPVTPSKGSICVSSDMGENVAATQGCFALFLAWGIGGEKFYFPEHAGMTIGPSNPMTYLRLEVHFDNPEVKSGIVDSSGFKIWLTPTMRKYDADIFASGLTVGIPWFIPSHAKQYVTRGHCTQECISEVLGDDTIYIFGVAGHTHLTGSAVKIRHFRNNVEQPAIFFDEHYDFNFQEFVYLKEEVEVRGTDSIMAECSFNTLEKDKIVVGGWTTEEEMCLTFLLYYPKKEFSWCESTPNPIEVLGSMNIQAEPTEDPPWYNVTGPEKYANRDYLDIMAEMDWNDVGIQKKAEKTFRSGFQDVICTNDFVTTFKAGFKAQYIDENDYTFRDEKSCKKRDDTNGGDGTIIDGTKAPPGGTNGAAVRALSFSIMSLTWAFIQLY